MFLKKYDSLQSRNVLLKIQEAGRNLLRQLEVGILDSEWTDPQVKTVGYQPDSQSGRDDGTIFALWGRDLLPLCGRWTLLALCGRPPAVLPERTLDTSLMPLLLRGWSPYGLGERSPAELRRPRARGWTAPIGTPAIR